MVEQKQAELDSRTSVMEEYSSTAAFSSFICLLFCSKIKKKKEGKHHKMNFVRKETRG